MGERAVWTLVLCLRLVLGLFSCVWSRVVLLVGCGENFPKRNAARHWTCRRQKIRFFKAMEGSPNCHHAHLRLYRHRAYLRQVRIVRFAPRKNLAAKRYGFERCWVVAPCHCL